MGMEVGVGVKDSAVMATTSGIVNFTDDWSVEMHQKYL